MAMALRTLIFIVLLIVYVLLSRRVDEAEVDADALQRRKRRRVYEEVQRKKRILAAAYIINNSRHQRLPGVGRGHGSRRSEVKSLFGIWLANLRNDL